MADGKVALFCARWRWWLLAAIVVLGTIGRARGLSTGTLYPDDAWVALTSHFPLSTSSHMLVTTPGFTLFMQGWTSLAPGTTWFLQLPDLATSVAGIVVIYLLATYFKAPAWAALGAAAILASSNEAMAYAVHIKPYADDVLCAAAIIWAAEAVRRSMTPARLAILAAVSVATAAWSFINAVVVLGAYLTLCVIWLRRREMTLWLLGSAGVAGALIVALYLAIIRHQTTPSLVRYWRPSYLALTSPHSALHSVRRTLNGIFIQQLAATPHATSLKALHTVLGVALLALVITGAIAAWRTMAIPIGVISAAVLVAAARKIPLGSNRTDAYLFPALLLLIVAGAIWLQQRLSAQKSRLGLRCASIITIAALVVPLVLAGAYPPRYLGGNLRAAAAVARTEVANHPGSVLVIEGTARWPWAFGEDPAVTLIFGPGFNTGYAPVGSQHGVLLMPASYAESGFSTTWLTNRLVHTTRVVTIAYAGFTGLPEHKVILQALRARCFGVTKVSKVNEYTVTVLERTSATCAQ